MKLLFKQRFFSWFDSYDIYNEADETLYTVKGQLSWGHCLKIYDASGYEVGTVKERILTWLPKFEMYLGDNYLGCISKEFSFFRPKFNIDCNGWHIDGDWFEWDYSILNSAGHQIASVAFCVYIRRRMDNFTSHTHRSCILRFFFLIATSC